MRYYLGRYVAVCIAMLAILFGCADGKAASNKYSIVNPQQVVAELPSGDVWLNHVKRDLLPFWTMPEALGEPIGNFPTYRNNNGTAHNPSNPSIEYRGRNLDKDYVRMKSRQIYAYSVGYHLTGDKRLLAYAKAGIDYLRANAFFNDKDGKKGVYSYFSYPDKKWGPEQELINSQDLSYALNGMAFYYYLTRDPEVLDNIVEVKDYIFANYYDQNTNLVSWYMNKNKKQSKELVATLDQINAYMLCLAPIIPDEYHGRPLRQEWKANLEDMAHAIIKEYYSPSHKLFWGTDDKRIGARHVDYGHSIKSFWMIYQIGKLVNNHDLISFVETEAPALLEKAYISQTGSWASRPGDQGKEWWIYAELDQMAATLSLANKSYAKYLPGTYRFWLDHMVDRDHKEMWTWVSPDGTPASDVPKQFEWKNGFHSFEHALVSYITSQQLKNQPVTLYYAFKDRPQPDMVRPYVFSGAIASVEEQKDAWVVTFENIR